MNKYIQDGKFLEASLADAGLEGVDADVTNPDLQQRSGCAYCHALLEPSAAHWGRWTEQGVGYLSAASFPPTREDCEWSIATTPTKRRPRT